MKVENGKPVQGVDRAPAQAAEPAQVQQARQDRVSTAETRNAVALVESARRTASGSRSARLREIEAAVRSGTFKPDAGKIAEEILAAAEADAHLRALFQG